MISVSRAVLLIGLALLHIVPAQAGLNDGVVPLSWTDLMPAARFAEDIPDIATVAGVALGERPIRPDEVLAYYQALDQASPCARLIELGRTHEDRPLVMLAVSDAGTIARLDDFQKEHARRLDPRLDGVPTVEQLTGTKAVAWMAYGIHGGELSSTDAAVALAYWLVAGTDDQALQMRDSLLVLIDPCENPDGRNRYLTQVMSFAHRRANPDQDDLSHRAVWPWGRGNHYLFDLNRDWFSMTQPESERARLIARWVPQILVDSHEMGANATYLFPPPRHPFNPHLPANTSQWELTFSDDQAAALDEKGFPYYSGEWNEEFFPGYGSSWSSYHGTIGILYEMSRTSGTLVQKRGGTMRTFAEAITHQFTSSVANLTTLAQQKAQILHDQVTARQQAIDLGKNGQLKAWVFAPDPRQPDRLPAMAVRLQAQGIEVESLQQPTKIRQLVDMRTGEEADRNLPVGSILIRAAQPSGYLAHALLDPHVPMSSTFLQEEREYLEKRKGSRLYETTAWSVPLSVGVPAYWSPQEPKGSWRPFAEEGQTVGAEIPAQFTYLILDGDPDLGPRVLADLLQGGFNVQAATRDFSVEGHDFRAGAMVLRRETLTPVLLAELNGIVQRHRVHLVPIQTSRATTGPDLGGTHFDVLVAPRVGVLAGSPVSTGTFGAVWHYLDQELDLRFSNIDISRVRVTDLSRYNVLVFPPVRGGTGMYRQTIGPTGMQKIRDWVQAGGTAIGLEGGAAMLADPETELTQARFRSQALALHPSPVWSISSREAEEAGQVQATGLRVTGVVPEGEEASVGSLDHGHLYDVSPLLGPGALPFTQGIAQGTALGTRPVLMADWIKPTLAAGKAAPDEADLAAVDERLRRFMPQGAMLRVDLDPELFLGYGLDEDITVWFGGDDTLVAGDPVQVGGRFAEIDRLHLAGLLWPEAAARLAHTAYLTRETVGRGQVILFAANPLFRRWMKDSERMFGNAVLLGPGLGTRWSTPW
jgi:hypothetical protein|nr:M14 family zinc carboxypeptidase [Candidatus Krumholzibacteria bacterium]